MFLIVILTSFVIISMSLLSVVLFIHFAHKFLYNNIQFLLGFSSAVFSYVAFELASQSIKMSSFIYFSYVFIIGVLVILLLFKTIKWFHHHEIPNEPHTHTKNDTYNIIYGNALHNGIDGMLLAFAFSVNLILGMITAISIMIHEIVQKISEFILLKNAGFSTSKSLFINFLISLNIFIGIFFGLLTESLSEYIWIFFGLASGVYFIIIFHDILPSSKIFKNIKSIGGFVFGIMLMSIIGLFF